MVTAAADARAGRPRAEGARVAIPETFRQPIRAFEGSDLEE